MRACSTDDICTHATRMLYTWQVEQKPGGRGRGREWATLGVHPLSWLLSNNRLEKVPFVSVPHTSSNRLLLSNQDKGCTPSVTHSLALPLGPALDYYNGNEVVSCPIILLSLFALIPKYFSCWIEIWQGKFEFLVNGAKTRRPFFANYRPFSHYGDLAGWQNSPTRTPNWKRG